MGFRIGRKFAQHSYPEAPRGGVGPALYASNVVIGPGTNQPIGVSPSSTQAFTDTNGSFVEAGALTVLGVPITPRVTGDVHLSAMLNVENASASSGVTVYVYVRINGTLSADPIAVATLDASVSFGSIPVEFGLPALLPLGVTAHVNLVLVASVAGAVLTTASASPLTAPSVMTLQEVSLPTG